MTAATATHLIESVGARVNMCESQGGYWITIRRGISHREAELFGFNLDSPAVQDVFAEAAGSRIVGGTYDGMTPAEVLADRDAYNLACGGGD